MKDLPAAMEKICQLKGEAIGMQCLINALLSRLCESERQQVLRAFEEEAEAAKVVFLNSARAGEHVLDGLDTYVLSVSARFR